MVDKNQICRTQMAKNLQEVDIDCIITKATPGPILKSPEQSKREKMKTSTTAIKINGNCQQDVKQNTHRVGKLDVSKIEERHAEIKKWKKVNQLS